MKIIKTLSHLTWGAEKNSLLLIYKALILSRIEYGSIIYNSDKTNIKQILNPIHNQAIRLAIGAFRTSPIDSILCISDEPFLQIRRNKNILKYVTKKLNLPLQITYQLFTSSNQIRILKDPALTYTRICKDINWHFKIETSSPFLATPFWMVFPKLYTQLSHLNKYSTPHSIIVSYFKDIINSDFRNFNLIYIDASKYIHRTGCAFGFDTIKRLFKLPKDPSIFIAEIIAIKEAISYAESMSISKTLIISDSLSALTSLSSHPMKLPNK